METALIVLFVLYMTGNLACDFSFVPRLLFAAAALMGGFFASVAVTNPVPLALGAIVAFTPWRRSFAALAAWRQRRPMREAYEASERRRRATAPAPTWGERVSILAVCLPFIVVVAVPLVRFLMR